jgi:hypothetical protein
MLQHGGSIGHIPCGILPQAQLRHLMNQFGVEEALLARLRRDGPRLKRLDALHIYWFVIDPCGQQRDRDYAEQNSDSQGDFGSHEEPPLVRSCLVT